ncbi:hypothetical protein DID88_006169 [Monilinia fructigena]|uniref:Uncharacterized protein n=1 Tax=Monilinia fructigena TaxID=38457 RepID=A0A395J720_9HELO|nr:hypothetical protein DID88_006169 [Monilinia fructigena]
MSYCQRLEEEAIEAHSSPAAPPWRQTVPLQRSNTVSAEDSHAGLLIDRFNDPAAPTQPVTEIQKCK